MRAKSLILLVLALGCGLVAALGINQVLANRNTDTDNVIETSPILVAMKDIEFGAPLTADVLKLEDWPTAKVPEGSLTSLEAIKSRRARTKLYSGEPVLENKLTSGETSGPSTLIPDGLRVVSVQVNAESSNAGMLKPGNRVDVLVHLIKNSGRDISKTMTKTMLQDVRVFAVNDVYHLSREEKDEGGIMAKTVSLLVKPDQAELVMLASELGSIRLIMRSDEDGSTASTHGASVSQLISGEMETGDRDQENLVDEPVDDNGFLAMLNQQPAIEPEPVDLGPAWKMTLIEGEQSRLVGFDSEGNPAGEVMPGNPSQNWEGAPPRGPMGPHPGMGADFPGGVGPAIPGQNPVDDFEQDDPFEDDTDIE
jgi:pilus assembly protein CpaB